MIQETYRTVFQSWFGLTDAEASALVQFYCSEGRPIGSEALARALGISKDRVPVTVCSLRKAMETEALDCERGVGYFLTEVGMGECRGALWTIGEELRKAS